MSNIIQFPFRHSAKHDGEKPQSERLSNIHEYLRHLSPESVSACIDASVISDDAAAYEKALTSEQRHLLTWSQQSLASGRNAAPLPTRGSASKNLPATIYSGTASKLSDTATSQPRNLSAETAAHRHTIAYVLFLIFAPALLLTIAFLFVIQPQLALIIAALIAIAASALYAILIQP